MHHELVIGTLNLRKILDAWVKARFFLQALNIQI